MAAKKLLYKKKVESHEPAGDVNKPLTPLIMRKAEDTWSEPMFTTPNKVKEMFLGVFDESLKWL